MKLLMFYRVFPAFLDILYAFGRKSEEDDLGFNGFRSHFASDGVVGK